MAGKVADGMKSLSNGPLVKRLTDVDWDFPDRVAHSQIEGIHPYPAKFVSELPGALLDILPIPSNTAVLDPFCGSGATLVEAQRRGLSSVGIDLNPIACLITQVKTSPQPDGLKDVARDVCERAKLECAPKIPKIPRLDHWFGIQVQIALASLIGTIATVRPAYRDALRLALSSIIVRVSYQDSDTRYAAVEKNVTSDDVFSEFVRSSDRISDALSGRDYHLAPATVFTSDTLSIDAEQIASPIGAVITSPPYPNAYEYWLYHKYRMYWLGYDPVEVKEREIGARAHFFKRNHHTADDFARQMAQTFRLIDRVAVPNAFVCFVVGRSRIHGRIVDNAMLVERAACDAGFQPIFSAQRALMSARKSFNLSHSNIKTENVLVFQHKGLSCV